MKQGNGKDRGRIRDTILLVVLIAVCGSAGALGARAFMIDDQDGPPTATETTPSAPRRATPPRTTPRTAQAPNVPRPVDPVITQDPSGLEQTLALQFTDAPVPTHEWRLPSGSTPASGVVLVMHGGSWFGVGPERLRTMDAEVQRWNDRGWATLNTTYRPGRDSITDVVRIYDSIRRWQGQRIPIGVVGASAGGHLAMMLGVLRHDVAFIEAEAGPTDIPGLAGTAEADDVRTSGTRAFGVEAGVSMSPLANAERITAPLLLVATEDDAYVPIDQMHRMVAARPQTQALTLSRGDIPWVHSPISADALQSLTNAEDDLARSVVHSR